MEAHWRVSTAAVARDEHASPPVKHMSQQQQSQVWLEYAYSKHFPALQWLPTACRLNAEWIANNMQDELGFPDRSDPMRGWTPLDGAGVGWTPAEQKSILQNHRSTTW